MKFCCDRFKSFHERPDYYGLNIRIVKYPTDELFDKDHLYRFYISEGYVENQKNVIFMNIAFCPFCGENLFKFYDNDCYINQEPGPF
jgi:hypothetical protein